MGLFKPGMFRFLRATVVPLKSVEVSPPDPLPPEARARQRREEEEAEQLAARERASQEEIERACKEQGFWWPEDGALLNRFGTPRRRGLLERIGDIFGGW